jgi:hypothetical protein
MAESKEVEQKKEVEQPKEVVEVKEGEYHAENLPFAKAEVVRLMKELLPSNRWVTEKVKVEANILLYKILKDITLRLAEEPFATINYAMFKEAAMKYEMLDEIEAEKTRIIRSLEKIKADCDVMMEAVDRKFKHE